MGKRSDFERYERDAYATPPDAVSPLVPYLMAGNVRSFAEPCAGEGNLVRHLQSYGLRCVAKGDIANGRDALKWTINDCCRANILITKGEIFDDRTQVVMVFVDGKKYTPEAPPAGGRGGAATEDPGAGENR